MRSNNEKILNQPISGEMARKIMAEDPAALESAVAQTQVSACQVVASLRLEAKLVVCKDCLGRIRFYILGTILQFVSITSLAEIRAPVLAAA